MKILFVTRKTLNTSPGGDTVQIFSTARYLTKLGIKVDIKSSSEIINYTEYDIMHFFNIIRPDDILPHILKSTIPFVVSTIFVDYSEYEKNNRRGIIGIASRLFSSDQMEYIKALGRYLINGDKINSKFYLLNGHRASVKKIASKAKMLLPNSRSEYYRFVEAYNIDAPYMPIVNAIDLSVFNSDAEPNPMFKNEILCVGRIEGRKNQLNLIKALIDTDFKLTIVGKPSPNHMSYFNECKLLVSKHDNMRIIEHASHDQLASIYLAAKVHVLPSWFETTGLSSLEAAVMDCNIVVTKKGDAEEYFRDMAYYCEPDDVGSIRNAVTKAFDNPIDTRLKIHVQNNFTWEHTAAQTLSAYEKILNNKK